MASLKAQLVLVLVGAAVAFAGCDDDRAVVGLNDDQGAAGGGAGGQTSEGTGEAGTPPSVIDAGGIGGSALGQAGAGGTGAASCPADLDSAEGEPCSVAEEGLICSDGRDDPCGFGHSLYCENGRWYMQEAFPAPCGGAGGGSGGGGADAGAANGGGG